MVEQSNTEIPNDESQEGVAGEPENGGDAAQSTQLEGEPILTVMPGLDVYPQHLRMLEGAHVASASGVGPMEIWVSYGLVWDGGQTVGDFRRKRVGWDEARRLQELAQELGTQIATGRQMDDERVRLTEIAAKANADVLSAAEALAEIPREGRGTLVKRCLKAVEDGGGAEELERAVVLAGQVQNDDLQAPREVIEVVIWLLANWGSPGGGTEEALDWVLRFEEEGVGLTGLVAACDDLFRDVTGRRPSSTYHSRVDRAGALRFRVDASPLNVEPEEEGALHDMAGEQSDPLPSDGDVSAYAGGDDEDGALVAAVADSRDESSGVDTLIAQLRTGYGEDLRGEGATQEDLDRIVDVLAQTRRDVLRVRQETLSLKARMEKGELSFGGSASNSVVARGPLSDKWMLILAIALFVGAAFLFWADQSGPDTGMGAFAEKGPGVPPSSSAEAVGGVTAEGQQEVSGSIEEGVRTSPVEMPGDDSDPAAKEESAIAAAEKEAEAPIVEEVIPEETATAVEPIVEEVEEVVVAEEPTAAEVVEVAAVVEEPPAQVEPEAVEPPAVIPPAVVAEGREVAAERYGVGINPTHRLISRSKLYRFKDRDFIPATDLPGGDALVNACILSQAPKSKFRGKLYRGFTAIRLSCAGEMKVVCEILGCPAEQSCVTSASWVKPCN